MTAKKISTLSLKSTERKHCYNLFDGEAIIGSVSPVVYGAHDHYTGWYCYELPGFYPSGKSFINWQAGRTPMDAAIKLAHKAGYK